MRTSLTLLLLAHVTTGTAVAQGRRQSPDILVRNVTVIDGTGAAPRRHQDIVIRAGKFAAIVATGTPSGTTPDSIIDGSGLFAMPGLIDAHVHLGTGSWDARAEMMKGALMGGITSALDLAGDARATGDLQRAVIAGQIPGPQVYFIALFGGPAFFTDPRVLDASRGYIAGSAPWMQSVQDTTDFSRAMTLARGTGAMGVKLYAALDSMTIVRATNEAHRQGLKVIAHSTTFPGKPLDLISAGVDMLTHTPYLVWQGSPRTTDFPARARGDFRGIPAGSPVIDTMLIAMRDQGTALNPTLAIFASESDSVAQLRTPWMYAVTRSAARLGVRIVAGTDGLYNPQRDSLPGLHRELELLVSGAGLTPLEAITAGTLNAAWAAGVDSSAGTIRVGMNADMLLLTADPAIDIRNTRSIRMVIQRGRIVRQAGR